MYVRLFPVSVVSWYVLAVALLFGKCRGCGGARGGLCPSGLGARAVSPSFHRSSSSSIQRWRRCGRSPRRRRRPRCVLLYARKPRAPSLSLSLRPHSGGRGFAKRRFGFFMHLCRNVQTSPHSVTSKARRETLDGNEQRRPSLADICRRSLCAIRMSARMRREKESLGI